MNYSQKKYLDIENMFTTLDIIMSFIIGTYLLYLGYKLIDKDYLPIAIYALAFAMICYMLCAFGIISKLH